jgi:hypothetical protein
VDSLRAVELRKVVFAEMDSDLSVFNILSPMSLANLALEAISNCKAVIKEMAALAKEQIEE